MIIARLAWGVGGRIHTDSNSIGMSKEQQPQAR